ncbi:RxLR effector protein [Phytophthora megakarya]|uniref:RxLR effector protein n=1 Tax=Phytophthora megakarya TaxID=4795 RepID=A0A225USC8_9STRA|nr:RxLR effector protein [Phytophthora megakarya]
MHQYPITLLLFLCGHIAFLSVVSTTRYDGLSSDTAIASDSEAQVYGVTGIKRHLREEKFTTFADITVDEERARTRTFLKHSLYMAMASFNIQPEILHKILRINSGKAPLVFHRFYESYRWWFKVGHQQVPVSK